MAAGWFGGARATFALEESLLECCCDAVLEDVVAVDLRCTEEPGEPLTSRMALMTSWGVDLVLDAVPCCAMFRMRL
jgi:hypothetical protein